MGQPVIANPSIISLTPTARWWQVMGFRFRRTRLTAYYGNPKTKILEAHVVLVLIGFQRVLACDTENKVRRILGALDQATGLTNDRSGRRQIRNTKGEK